MKWTVRSHVSICLLCINIYVSRQQQHKYSVHKFSVLIWPVYSFNTQKITPSSIHTYTLKWRSFIYSFEACVCVCVCCDAIDLVLLCRCNYSIHSVELILNGGHSLRQIGRFKWSIVWIVNEWVRKEKEEKEEDAKQVPIQYSFFAHLLISHTMVCHDQKWLFVCWYEYVRSHARTHTHPIANQQQHQE